MEAVSLELEKRFKGYDFENILNLLANREVNTHLAEPTFGKAVGFVVAIASFMLKMVPSSIIKDDLQLDYTLYQKNVFYVLSTSLFYVIILLGGTLIRNYKAKIRKAYFANILSYVKYKNQSQINAANNEQ